MRVRVLIACAALPILLWAVLPMVSTGAAPSQAQLGRIERKLDAAREKVGRKKGTERVLSGDIAQYSQRIDRLQGRITSLGRRVAVLQADLDRKRAELEEIRGELRSERSRLVRLRARLKVTQRALSDRLVEIYKAEQPDLVTVVMNSKGFADLLERGEFLERVSDQDRRVVTLVRTAKADAVRTERKLEGLEKRQATVTAIVASRRAEIGAARNQLIGTRVGYAKTRAGKNAALMKVRADRTNLQAHVDDLEAAQAQVQAALQKAQAANAGSFRSGAAGPVRRGSGSMVWPVNGPITGVFGESRPGHMHAGMDIAAGEGTPIRAADSGKVVLMQGTGASGGYGNFTCVQHSATTSSCYAHQSRFATSSGASVGQGQVIGYVGNTGHSFGAHLHFEVRVNGAAVNPAGYL